MIISKRVLKAYHCYEFMHVNLLGMIMHILYLYMYIYIIYVHACVYTITGGNYNEDI